MQFEFQQVGSATTYTATVNGDSIVVSWSDVSGFEDGDIEFDQEYVQRQFMSGTWLMKGMTNAEEV